MSTMQSTYLSEFVLLSPIVGVILNVAPYVITIMAFTALYISLPNTKVKFVNGLVAGVIAGCVLPVFSVYIHQRTDLGF